MADGGFATFLIIASATTAAVGAGVSARDQIEANKERQRVLEQELRAKELAALDEENRRLLALREANEDILARAGGIEAWASPSLIAARAFNFKVANEDIDNINFNKAYERANVSARIAMLRRNSRVARTQGILGVIDAAVQGANQYSVLGKGGTKTTTTNKKSKTTTGRYR